MAQLQDTLNKLFNNATNGLIDQIQDDIITENDNISSTATIYKKIAERLLQKANEEVREHIFSLNTICFMY